MSESINTGDTGSTAPIQNIGELADEIKGLDGESFSVVSDIKSPDGKEIVFKKVPLEGGGTGLRARITYTITAKSGKVIKGEEVITANTSDLKAAKKAFRTYQLNAVKVLSEQGKTTETETKEVDAGFLKAKSFEYKEVGKGKFGRLSALKQKHTFAADIKLCSADVQVTSKKVNSLFHHTIDSSFKTEEGKEITQKSTVLTGELTPEDTRTNVDFDKIETPLLKSRNDMQHVNLFAESAKEYPEVYIKELQNIIQEGSGSQEFKDQKCTKLKKILSNTNKFVEGVYKQTGDGVPIDTKQMSREELSGKGEAGRQELVKSVLKEMLYETLSIALEKSPEEVRTGKFAKNPEETTKAMGALYLKCCQGMAKKEQVKLEGGKGFIQIKSGFSINTPDQREMAIKGVMTQIGMKFHGSLATREGKESRAGYNLMHCEKRLEVGGEETKLKYTRSGANDNHKVSKNDIDSTMTRIELSPQLDKKVQSFKKINSEIKHAAIMDRLVDMDKGIKKFDQAVKEARENSDPIALMAALKAGIPPSSKWDSDKAKDKLEDEIKLFISDRIVIKRNKEMIAEGFEAMESSNVTKEGDKKHGFDLGNDLFNVRDKASVLSANPDLKLDDKTKTLLEEVGKPPPKLLAMNSLQTLANVNKGWAARAAKFLQDKINYNKDGVKKVKGKLGKIFDALVKKDNSEMPTMYREGTALKMYAKEQKCKAIFMPYGLNKFATQKVGPFSVKKLFLSGTVDKARYTKVMAMRQDAIDTVYKINSDRSELLGKAIEAIEKQGVPKGTEDTLLAMMKEKLTIDTLMQQIFTKGKNGKLDLKKPANDKMGYEVMNRFILLQMIGGGKINFHCRSGNNRTNRVDAALLRLAASIVASIDIKDLQASYAKFKKQQQQKIPTMSETGGTLAGKDRHWSEPIMMECLKDSQLLQRANKGPFPGTKVKYPEEKNKTFHNAVVSGGFGASGKPEISKFVKFVTGQRKEIRDSILNPEKIEDRAVVEAQSGRAASDYKPVTLDEVNAYLRYAMQSAQGAPSKAGKIYKEMQKIETNPRFMKLRDSLSEMERNVLDKKFHTAMGGVKIIAEKPTEEAA